MSGRPGPRGPGCGGGPSVGRTATPVPGAPRRRRARPHRRGREDAAEGPGCPCPAAQVRLRLPDRRAPRGRLRRRPRRPRRQAAAGVRTRLKRPRRTDAHDQSPAPHGAAEPVRGEEAAPGPRPLTVPTCSRPLTWKPPHTGRRGARRAVRGFPLKPHTRQPLPITEIRRAVRGDPPPTGGRPAPEVTCRSTPGAPPVAPGSSGPGRGTRGRARFEGPIIPFMGSVTVTAYNGHVGMTERRALAPLPRSRRSLAPMPRSSSTICFPDSKT